MPTLENKPTPFRDICCMGSFIALSPGHSPLKHFSVCMAINVDDFALHIKPDDEWSIQLNRWQKALFFFFPILTWKQGTLFLFMQEPTEHITTHYNYM